MAENIQFTKTQESSSEAALLKVDCSLSVQLAVLTVQK